MQNILQIDARQSRFCLTLCVAWFLAVNASVASAGTFYVAPNGSPSALGTMAQPLDFATAIGWASPARPGDTIWVRGGTYRGPLESRMNGTVAQPITVRAYPGERATIDGYLGGGGMPLSIVGSHVVFWGLEVMSSDPSRVAGANSRGASGIDVLGANVKVINMVVHDNINGIGAWMVPDTELYGNVIYNNGVEGSDRGHGHSIYAQNNAPTPKLITDNVLLNSYSIGMQAYTSGGRIDNIRLEGNIAFNHGILSLISGAKANYLWQGPAAQNPWLISNYAYYSPGRNGRSIDLTGGCANAVIQNNYLMQGWNRWECGAAAINGNTIFGDPGALSGYTNNTFSSSRPTANRVFVRPNRYEPGRANIAIYNWELQSAVSVDLSATGLANGSGYEVRDAQNFYGPLVAAGTYDGNPVSIRMTGLTVAPPIGGQYTPPHTGAEFGAFIVLPRTATTGTPPTASLSADQTTIYAGQSTTLTWSTSGATSVSIDPGVGTVAASGSVTVSPATTATYALTAVGNGGITTKTVSIGVNFIVSADGAIVPPLNQLTDPSGNVWTLGSGGRTLRNGIQVGGGLGSKLLWYSGSIYALGTDSYWYQWTSSWARISMTQPGSSAPPPPPPPPSLPPPPPPPTTTNPPTGGAASPDGSMIPGLNQIADASGGVWTIASNGVILRNGGAAANGVGSRLLWQGGTIYALGTDNNWYRWRGAYWESIGPTQPSSQPPAAGASADGAMVPALPQLVDAAGVVWSIGGGNRILRNGTPAENGVGSKLLWYGNSIYALGTDNNWWRWTGSYWARYGLRQPGT